MAPWLLRNLAPKRERLGRSRPLGEVVKSFTWTQWGLFISGWLAWTCDAADFFAVSLTVVPLRQHFNRSTYDVTTSITLTLLFRTAGAVVFGLLSDRFGRKWPLVDNLVIVSILSLGTGFVQTFKQFLAVRSLFGVGMGGIWGLATASALENIPVEARGIGSGIVQQGYAAGSIIASIINLYLVPRTSWRALFWTVSGISAFVAVFRALLPESEVFLRARREKQLKLDGDKPAESATRIFIHEVGQILRNQWLLSIYVVMLTSGFSFLAHGTQDLYPTYLQENKRLTSFDASVATIIGSCGAIAGGAVVGGSSQYIGRRLAMIISLLIAGASIPLWILPSTFGKLSAGAFCIQFGVRFVLFHRALGVVPIFLSEISPPAFRSTFAGVAYQMGTMVSSASAQIEATGGEHLRTTIQGPTGPENVPNYAFIQGIFIGCMAAFVIVLALVGPENHGRHFERAKVAFQAGASKEDVNSIPEEIKQFRVVGKLGVGRDGGKEKGEI